MFQWSQAYSVHVRAIDDEHRELFRLADNLRVAMMEQRGAETVGRTLDQLVRYTLEHFDHEERIMRDCNFPEYAEHKAEHDALTNKVRHFQVQHRAGQRITVQVLHFLKDWLVHHIAVRDVKIQHHVREAVARRA